MNVRDLVVAMLPEHLLLAGIVLVIARDLLPGKTRDGFVPALAFLVLAAVAAAFLALVWYQGSPFPAQLSVAPQDLTAKAVIFALAIPVLMLSRDDFADGRFPVLLLSSLYGIGLMLSADSFLTLFVGLELMSLPVYALVVLDYRGARSAEAALKYLVLGGAASAALLMGAALIFGAVGSLSTAAFAAALGSTDAMAIAGAMLVIAAFFLKAAIVPFHAWAPDAYEGASVPVTAYMAAIVKGGVLLAAVRLFGQAPLAGPVADFVAVLPLASIVWGNLAAMRQQSFRRMIAYSSIAHAGYLFYALLGDGATRMQAVLFYVLAYGLLNVLAFAALPRRERDADADRLDSLRGLFSRAPVASLMIAVAMLSLAGIPPLPGFVAKFLIFKNVMSAGYTLYAVLGLVGSYLGIYFYLRVIQLMFMSEGEHDDGRGAPRRLMRSASLLSLAGALALMILPGWFIAQF
ncbi:MAG: NADH-quinone oxidoreductase subunit N [Vicinamibacteria bacterium]